MGLLTVGSSRSGLAHDHATQECLQVIARHAARELLQHQLISGQLRAKESEAFREFAHGVMHDLKNFASTLSMIGRNARSHGDNPSFREDAFRSVVETSEKMRRLCNSLRSFSLDATAPRVDRDLSALVRVVTTEFRDADVAHIKVDLDEGIHVHVPVFRGDHLQQNTTVHLQPSPAGLHLHPGRGLSGA